MKKIIMGFFGFCFSLVAIAFLIPFLIDVNTYKPEILAKTKEALGRDLTIEGKISLRLLPLPTLSVDKIQLANVSEGSQPSMASVDRIELQIALFPLFSKKVEIDKIKLVGANILLERLGNGQGNWEFSPLQGKETPALFPSSSLPASSTPASSSHSFDVSIKSCEITEGQLKYKDGETLYDVHNISSNISLTSLQGPFHAKGQLDYKTGQTVYFEVDLGTFKDTQSLRANLTLGKSQIKTEGTLSTIDKSYKGTLEGTGEWENLAQLAGFNFVVPTFLGKQLDARMDVSVSLKKILLDNLSLRGGDLSAKGHFSVLLEDDVKIQGELNGLPGALGISFSSQQKKNDLGGFLKADVKDLKSFLKHIHYDVAGIPAPLLQASSFNTHFSVTPLHINFSDLNLDFTSARVGGEMEWLRQTSKPSFSVNLQTDNLNPFLALLDIKMITNQNTAGTITGKIEGDQKNLTFDTQATLDSTVIALQGQARDLAQHASFETKLDIKSTSFIDLLKRFEVTLPSLFNHIDVTGKIGGNLAKIQMDTRTTLKDFILLTQGFINNISQKPNFDIHISASHPDIKRLLGALGTSAHTTSGPFTLKTHLGGTPSLFKLGDIQGILGAAGSFSGSLDYSRLETKPYINASLRFTSVNLDHLLSFLKDSATVPAFPHIMLAATATSPMHSPWSRDILDLNFLSYFDADLKLTSEKISKKEMVFDHPDLIAQIKNGILKIVKVTASVYGGSFTLKGQTDSQKNNASQYTFALKGAELKNLSPKESYVKITHGQLDVSGNLVTSGNSIYKLVSALEGKITLDAHDGIVSGFDLQAITSNLMKQNRLEGIVNLLSASFKKGETPFSSLEGLIDIQQGIAHIKKLTLLAKGGEGAAHGTINFPAYTMNVDARFSLTEPKNIPSIGVKFIGSIDAPVRTIDSDALQKHMTTNVLKDVIGSITSGEKKPADILGAILGGGGSDEQASPSPQSSNPAPQNSDADNIVKTPEKALKSLLKGLF